MKRKSYISAVLLASILITHAGQTIAVAGPREDCAQDLELCRVRTKTVNDRLKAKAAPVLAQLNAGADCKSPAWDEVRSIAADFDIHAAYILAGYEITKRKIDNGDIVRSMADFELSPFIEGYDIILMLGPEIRVRIGEVALAAKCYKLADEQFRQVIKTATDGKQAAIRQRALIGIEDIRSKQSSFLCSWFGKCY